MDTHIQNREKERHTCSQIVRIKPFSAIQSPEEKTDKAVQNCLERLRDEFDSTNFGVESITITPLVRGSGVDNAAEIVCLICVVGCLEVYYS